MGLQSWAVESGPSSQPRGTLTPQGAVRPRRRVEGSDRHIYKESDPVKVPRPQQCQERGHLPLPYTS